MGARRSTGTDSARWFLFPTHTWEPLLLTRVVRVRAFVDDRTEKVQLSATGNSRDQKSNQSRLGFVQQIQTRADVKIVLFTATDSAYSTWVITPTLSYASGTWTLSREHERMIRWTQRKMLRLIVQTKRKFKKKKLRPAKTRMMEKMKKQTTDLR